ncbi:hypothetical protein TcasGA2_TC010529 [Tribolium castaneum]|uniref:Uncharacterized protein n=1 Tax=Tribolium castaneum TaxID=7070 RepID=A0A139WL34_TRICA|nr:PREDICTED: uncharacterized protein LOC103314591 isoform X1 [Tribolium castaneum]KYB28527.1 hypothetical protein TcasGA2_TC010529 [Tribolium castaneum]|eukprot:XP_008199225.1 PREDICTED: uncharacterized protein LOC103314591 isoform X1 [Tribolium castaneum]
MRIAFGVIFVTGIFGGFFAENVFALPVARHHVITKDLDLDEMYKSYTSISNDRDDYNDKVTSRVYLDSPQISVSKNGKQQKTKQTAYLLVNTMSQRNKRYISYLTLCHFKICNMGRKRTSRYFHMIRQLDDNEA